MILAILGPQGSGKGTQAAKLSEKYNLFNLDVGAVLREMAKTNPEIDVVVNKRGALLPDDQVFKIVEEYLDRENLTDNILFDGYPRSIEQYNFMSGHLAKQGKRFDGVIFLTIPDEVAIERLSSRRIHKKTGEIYNLITNPPSADINPDDLEQREDDKPEAIKERLKMYHEQTQPLIEHLKSQGLVIEVDGTKPIEEVFEKICQSLN